MDLDPYDPDNYDEDPTNIYGGTDDYVDRIEDEGQGYNVQQEEVVHGEYPDPDFASNYYNPTPYHYSVRDRREWRRQRRYDSDEQSDERETDPDDVIIEWETESEYEVSDDEDDEANIDPQLLSHGAHRPPNAADFFAPAPSPKPKQIVVIRTTHSARRRDLDPEGLARQPPEYYWIGPVAPRESDASNDSQLRCTYEQWEEFRKECNDNDPVAAGQSTSGPPGGRGHLKKRIRTTERRRRLIKHASKKENTLLDKIHAQSTTIERIMELGRGVESDLAQATAIINEKNREIDDKDRVIFDISNARDNDANAIHNLEVRNLELCQEIEDYKQSIARHAQEADKYRQQHEQTVQELDTANANGRTLETRLSAFNMARDQFVAKQTKYLTHENRCLKDELEESKAEINRLGLVETDLQAHVAKQEKDIIKVKAEYKKQADDHQGCTDAIKLTQDLSVSLNVAQQALDESQEQHSKEVQELKDKIIEKDKEIAQFTASQRPRTLSNELQEADSPQRSKTRKELSKVIRELRERLVEKDKEIAQLAESQQSRTIIKKLRFADGPQRMKAGKAMTLGKSIITKSFVSTSPIAPSPESSSPTLPSPFVPSPTRPTRSFEMPSTLVSMAALAPPRNKRNSHRYSMDRSLGRFPMHNISPDASDDEHLPESPPKPYSRPSSTFGAGRARARAKDEDTDAGAETRKEISHSEPLSFSEKLSRRFEERRRELERPSYMHQSMKSQLEVNASAAAVVSAASSRPQITPASPVVTIYRVVDVERATSSTSVHGEKETDAQAFKSTNGEAKADSPASTSTNGETQTDAPASTATNGDTQTEAPMPAITNCDTHRDASTPTATNVELQTDSIPPAAPKMQQDANDTNAEATPAHASLAADDQTRPNTSMSPLSSAVLADTDISAPAPRRKMPEITIYKVVETSAFPKIPKFTLWQWFLLTVFIYFFVMALASLFVPSPVYGTCHPRGITKFRFDYDDGSWRVWWTKNIVATWYGETGPDRLAKTMWRQEHGW